MRLSIASYPPCRASTHPGAQPACRQGRQGSCRQTGSSGCQYGGRPECLHFITVKHTPAKFLRAEFRAENEVFLLAGECKMGTDIPARQELAGYRGGKKKFKKSTMENDCLLPLNECLQINFNISTTYGYTANAICTQPGASVCIFGISPWKLSFSLAVGFTGPRWWVTLPLHTKDLVRNHMPSFIK